jgi:EAL domain-containing protein (putative c-di-GMP-specific phosphodiesterase class I)
MAVNISAVELRAKNFVRDVRLVLQDTGFEPQYLDLELTETFLLQDPKSTASILQSLWDIGVRFALDDFGTGYSSLSYMRRFPIDTLKIDESFVRDVTTDDESASVVQAIIDMGKGLHMRVVAEGVETREQLRFLRERACPEAQGYFLGRPVTAKLTSRLLAAASTAGSRAQLWEPVS